MALLCDHRGAKIRVYLQPCLWKSPVSVTVSYGFISRSYPDYKQRNMTSLIVCLHSSLSPWQIFQWRKRKSTHAHVRVCVGTLSVFVPRWTCQTIYVPPLCISGLCVCVWCAHAHVFMCVCVFSCLPQLKGYPTNTEPDPGVVEVA